MPPNTIAEILGPDLLALTNWERRIAATGIDSFGKADFTFGDSVAITRGKPLSEWGLDVLLFAYGLLVWDEVTSPEVQARIFPVVTDALVDALKITPLAKQHDEDLVRFMNCYNKARSKTRFALTPEAVTCVGRVMFVLAANFGAKVHGCTTADYTPLPQPQWGSKNPVSNVYHTERKSPMNTRITIVRGDITNQEGIDAIVNAAHPSLLGGGGVDGAVHRAAGPQLLEACRALPVVPRDDVDPFTKNVLTMDAPWRPSEVRCKVANAVVTPAFGLPAKVITHTVGPLYDPACPAEMAIVLRFAYKNSLTAAVGAGARTVAFPAISCGVFGYPLAAAADIALMAVVDESDMLVAQGYAVDEIRFVLFDPAAFDAFSSSRTHMVAAGAIRFDAP